MFDSSGLRLKVASLWSFGGDKQLSLPRQTMHEVEQRRVNGTLAGRSGGTLWALGEPLAAKPCARQALSNNATDVVK